MAGTLVVSTLNDGTNAINLSDVTSNRVRAWVSFKGRDTVTIQRSFNVTSITDNGVGDYTVNYASALPHDRYAVAMTSKEFDTTAGSSVVGAIGTGLLADIMTPQKCRVASKSVGSYFDAAFYSFMAVC